MRKFLFVFVFVFVFFPTNVFAQISLPKNCRVPNKEPGYCAWACISALGRYHKIESLHDLLNEREKEFTWEWDYKSKQWVKTPYVWIDYGSYKIREHRSPATHRAIANKLDSLKVKYRYQDYYSYDKFLLKDAIKNKQGCLVVVKWWKDSNGNAASATNNLDTHAILITDYNKDGISFFDPNDINHIYTATHKWFNYYWTGYTLVVEKKENE